jgi:hypothetical protein
VFALTRTLLEQQSNPVRLIPCTVTQLSPLLVTLLGGTNIPAVKIAGATYALGAANALVTSPGKPLILPIGA